MANTSISCQNSERILTPEEAAQAQLDAYNAHDIDAFTACYTDDIQVFAHPNTLTLEGMEAFRERYTKTLATPDLKAVVTERMSVGETVIDREIATKNGQDIHVIAIYHVIPETGKIDKVWFIR